MKKLLSLIALIIFSTLAMEPEKRNDFNSLKFECAGYLFNHPRLLIGKSISQDVHEHICMYQALHQEAQQLFEGPMKKFCNPEKANDGLFYMVENNSDNPLVLKKLQQLNPQLDFNQLRIVKPIGFLTPLMTAAYLRHSKIARLLFSHGADIDIQTVLGFTALHFAAMLNNYDFVKLSLNYQPDLTLTSSYGETVRLVAYNYYSHEIVTLLDEYEEQMKKKTNPQ